MCTCICEEPGIFRVNFIFCTRDLPQNIIITLAIPSDMHMLLLVERGLYYICIQTEYLNNNNALDQPAQLHSSTVSQNTYHCIENPLENTIKLLYKDHLKKYVKWYVEAHGP